MSTHQTHPPHLVSSQIKPIQAQQASEGAKEGDKQALNHQEKRQGRDLKAVRPRPKCGSMHMCKAMRHKKHHFAFLTAEGKEENPDRVFCCPAAGQCDPINPGSLHKGVSIEEKICHP